MSRRVPPAARDAYRALHRGKEPGRVATARVRVPTWLAAYGTLTAFEADRAEPDGTHRFRHEFEPHARPMWAFDETGQLHVVGGKYTVTDAGVEDTSPRRPARNTEAGMRHTYSVPLVNPSRGGLASGDRALAGDLAVVGGTAGAYVAGSSLLLDQTSLGAWAKTALAAVAGVAAGVALARSRVAPRAGLGLAVGGVVAGIAGAVEAVRAAAYLRTLGAPAAGAGALPAVVARAAPPPAVAGALPLGAPTGYSLTTLDGCGAAGGPRR